MIVGRMFGQKTILLIATAIIVRALYHVHNVFKCYEMIKQIGKKGSKIEVECKIFILLYIYVISTSINSLSANPTKWSNTLKQFVGNLPTNCLSVFDHFVKLALKGLKVGLCKIKKTTQK